MTGRGRAGVIHPPGEEGPRWQALYPPGLSWALEVAPGTVSSLLARAAGAAPGAAAVTYRERTSTWGELDAGVERLARGLHAAGVRAGDAVALLLGNTGAHPVALFAVLRLGAVAVHLSPLDPPRAVARKLADSGAGTLVTTNLAGVLPQAVAAGAGRLVVARDEAWGANPAALDMPEGALDMDALDGPAVAWPVVAPGDLALLQYTGGTTGAPRAAMLTHANLVAAVAIYDAWNEGWGRRFAAGDRALCVLPLFHIYALTAVLLRAVANGVELVIHARFAVDAVLEAIERGRVTHVSGVPTMWIALLGAAGLEERDFSSLKVVSSGGAALPHETAERFFAVTGHRLGGGWGMTETSPAGTNLVPGRVPEPGEVGVPLPGVALEVVALDDPRRVLPPGVAGELRVRGPNVMAGYWRRPEETAAAFVDGWFLTGDVGRMSEDGRFVLVDRKKDMLISGGFNVYPRAIEEALHEHPDVVEAAVIGVPDAYRGQAAKAFVVLRAGAALLTLAGVRAFLSERLGRHELPTALEVRDALPHTPVGKLAKRELR